MPVCGARPGLCSLRECVLVPISTASCRGQTLPINSFISLALPGQAAGKFCVHPGWDQLEDREICGVREMHVVREMHGVREMCGHTGHGGGWLGHAGQVPPAAESFLGTQRQQPKCPRPAASLAASKLPPKQKASWSSPLCCCFLSSGSEKCIFLVN